MTEVPEFTDQFRQLIDLMSPLSDQLASCPVPEIREKGKDLKVGMEAIKLAMFYMSEANRCLPIHAYFPATVLAAAAMEAMLLAKCAMAREQVVALPDFKRLPLTRTKDYRAFLCTLDLGKLLQIAEQLGWLSVAGIPTIFEIYVLRLVESDVANNMRDLILQMGSIGDKAAKYSKLYRDRLHPAKCVRDSAEVGQDFGIAGLTFVMLALCALIESGRRT